MEILSNEQLSDFIMNTIYGGATKDEMVRVIDYSREGIRYNKIKGEILFSYGPNAIQNLFTGYGCEKKNSIATHDECMKVIIGVSCRAGNTSMEDLNFIIDYTNSVLELENAEARLTAVYTMLRIEELYDKYCVPKNPA